jgi:hypothetical protein
MYPKTVHIRLRQQYINGGSDSHSLRVAQVAFSTMSAETHLGIELFQWDYLKYTHTQIHTSVS